MRTALTLRLAPAMDYDEPRDALAHDWIRHLAAVAPEVTPILVPNVLDDPVGYLQDLQVGALILTGGDDPGSTPRDHTERLLLTHALSVRLPTLAVCRGMQLLQIHLGGALTPIADDTHVAAMPLLRFTGPWTDRPPRGVPCYHRLGIAVGDPADGLQMTALDDQGHTEAAIYDDHVTAIMWHPERRAPTAADRSILRHALDLEKST